MKVAGFSIIRNAIKFDYPVVESIKSVLPLCDKFFIAVGKSEDDTEGLIKSIDTDKIEIIRTVWDENLRTGGRVLAVETNKAFRAIPEDYHWAFYIQADEVLHEKYIDTIHREMKANLSDYTVDGLLFKYKHFYGSYDYVGESFRWYRREIRVIRNDKSIYSYRDAQGFRKENNQKLKVKLIDAYIYHYGWVKNPIEQQLKQQNFQKLWHDDKNINTFHSDGFDYSNIDSLELFEETHPEVMRDRINKMNWKFTHDITKRNYSLKEKFKRVIEKISGYRIGEYKNYIIQK
jgi:hypothetical protein